MSRTLVILFDPREAKAGSGFGKALATPFDFLCLKGRADAQLGAEKVFVANLSEIPPADGLAAAIVEHCRQYTHVAAVASMQSKDILARLAGLLECGMITDAIAVDSSTQFKRPMLAGSVIATVGVLSLPVVITFRPAGFAPSSATGASTEVPIELSVLSKAKRVAVTARDGSRPDLSQAKVVVSGGRPLKDAPTFEAVIGGLADALGGAVGATRAAVDSGIAPNELQVGQTGKIVAPDLYIAAGISGSTQHMAGIKDSKVIVAINKDPDAPIFEFADLGLVADLYEAIPEIRSKLAK